MKNRILRAKLIIPAALLFCCLFCIIGSNPYAGARQSDRSLCYRSVLVEEGDSLWSLAEENMSKEWGSVREYVKAIKELNGIKSDVIYSGRYISIPYYL